MAETRTKIAQELTPAELADFCAALAGVPHGEMAARIQAMAEERGISIGRTAAYEFKNKEALPFLKRLELRKEKARLLNKHAADDTSGQTLADYAAGELSQLAFDFVTEADGFLDLTSKEGLKQFNVLTLGVQRLRTGDRKMIEQLQEQLKAMKAAQEAKDKAVLTTITEAGASPELVGAIREAMNFRPPSAAKEDQQNAA